MPIIEVNLLQGRPVEAKRRFATEVTELACNCLSVKPEQVRVIFREMPQEDYAIAGKLVADRDAGR